jgi:hypothetical protein
VKPFEFGDDLAVEVGPISIFIPLSPDRFTRKRHARNGNAASPRQGDPPA